MPVENLLNQRPKLEAMALSGSRSELERARSALFCEFTLKKGDQGLFLDTWIGSTTHTLTMSHDIIDIMENVHIL